MPLDERNATIADRFRARFLFFIDCPDCRRHRPLPAVEVARKYGWDFSFQELKRRIVCRHCRIRGRKVLHESNNGIPKWHWEPKADQIIKDNPTPKVIKGPWL
jgi:hypothetical protein